MNKKVFLLLMALFALSINSNAQRGDLITEKNGFQWYCYQGKEAYTVSGQKLFNNLQGSSKIKRISKIEFSLADENDEGVFIVTCDSKDYGNNNCKVFKPNGEYLFSCTNSKVYRVSLFFPAINEYKYYTRRDRSSYLNNFGKTLNDSFLYDSKGDLVGNSFVSFSIKGKALIYKKDDILYDGSYEIYRYDGKEVETGIIEEPLYIEEAHLLLSKHLTYNVILPAYGGSGISFLYIYHNSSNKAFEVNDGDENGIISYSLNWIAPLEKGYSHYKTLMINDNIYYCVKYKNDSYYHLISNNGIDLLGKEFESIDSLGENYLRVKDNFGYGIMTVEGKEIVPTNRGYNYFTYNSNEKKLIFFKKGYIGYIDENGNEFSSIRVKLSEDEIKEDGSYTSIDAIYNDGTKYYKVSKGGRYGLTDDEGKVIIPIELEALESAGLGYIKYKLNGFWGLMNYQGNILIDTDRGYTSIGDFKTFNKRFAYTMRGYKGECDETGKQISKIKVDEPKQNDLEIKQNNIMQNQEEKKVEVVVKQQQWVPCFACGGTGKCPQCDDGWLILPTGLERCLVCLHQKGVCQICHGSRGHYE